MKGLLSTSHLTVRSSKLKPKRHTMIIRWQSLWNNSY